MSNTPEIWSVSELYVKRKLDKIVIPAYQRKYVWKNEQRFNFIDSIKKGYPIPALILCKNNSDELLLIDGLQRFRTLTDYLNSPLDFDGEFIEELMSKSDPDEKEIEIERGYITKILKKHLLKKDELFEAKNNGDTVSKIRTIYDDIPHKILLEKIDKYTSCLQKIRDNLKISVIICECSPDDLYEIFVRINRGGTILTKNDINSASWMKYGEIITHNSEIIGKIDESFNVKKKNVRLNIVKKIIDEKFGIYEYLRGLADVIHDKYIIYGKTFGKIDDDRITNIFELISLCLSVENRNDLPIKVKNIPDIELFENRLFKSIDLFTDAIKGVLNLNVRAKSK